MKNDDTCPNGPWPLAEGKLRNERDNTKNSTTVARLKAREATVNRIRRAERGQTATEP